MCTSLCDMLRLPLEDALELCDIYPQVCGPLGQVGWVRRAAMGLLC